MSSIGEVVARLRQAVERIDRAAVSTAGARSEAELSHRYFVEAGRGTADPRMRAAITESRTAGEKAGKAARLLSEAADHICAYIEIIAPGAGPSRDSATDAMPDGKRLVNEAADREARFAKFHRRTNQFLADKEGDLKEFEQLSREAVSAFRDRVRPGDVQASVGTPKQAPAQPRASNSQHPVTDVLLAAAGLALVARAGVEKIRDIRRRRSQRDDETKAG